MQISQPVVTFVASPSGRAFTWQITADTWQSEYQSLQRYSSEQEAKTAYKEFLKVWKAEAAKIERGETRRYNMLAMLTQHGILRSRPKLTSGFDAFKPSA